ncbi:MAG: membrane protein insertion efficiency factor YidD [Bacteroidota bacterium]
MKQLFIPLSYFFIGVIKIYQHVISPLLPIGCRFEPSCSQYGVESFKKYGLFKGFYLTGKRISKCHPWGAHGHDPVP